MLMALFMCTTVLVFVGLTAWGSYRQYAGNTNHSPPWRTITIDTLSRTVPLIVLTITVTSLMSMAQ